MREVDVVVLGAGVSGNVAATLLSRKGYRVVMITQDAGTKNHLPESWIYNSLNCINSLGYEENILLTLKKQSKCCFCSADGYKSVEITVTESREKIESGDLVQVDRNQFDQELLGIALESGADLFPRSTVENCEISSSEVVTYVLGDRGTHKFISPFIIDATGKRAFLSNYLHLPIREEKLDARIACFSHFEVAEKKLDKITIVSIDGGYIFCIPVSAQKLSIGCVLSEQIIDPDTALDRIFDYAVSLSPYVTELIMGAKRVLPIILAKNQQKICLEPAGLRYRLVGDAAAFLDPFFCPGIDFAFFSAEQAVSTIEANSALNYQVAIMTWLEDLKNSVYQKLEKSKWRDVMRLFADPHLPFVVPLILTQAFTQLVGREVSLNAGIQIARRTYAISSC